LSNCFTSSGNRPQCGFEKKTIANHSRILPAVKMQNTAVIWRESTASPKEQTIKAVSLTICSGTAFL
jgi:hypothetical protein